MLKKKKKKEKYTNHNNCGLNGQNEGKAMGEKS